MTQTNRVTLSKPPRKLESTTKSIKSTPKSQRDAGAIAIHDADAIPQRGVIVKNQKRAHKPVKNPTDHAFDSTKADARERFLNLSRPADSSSGSIKLRNFLRRGETNPVNRGS